MSINAYKKAEEEVAAKKKAKEAEAKKAPAPKKTEKPAEEPVVAKKEETKKAESFVQVKNSTNSADCNQDISEEALEKEIDKFSHTIDRTNYQNALNIL